MSSELRKKFLENYARKLQENIYLIEVEIRFLERTKIKAREGSLVDIQKAINEFKKKIKGIEERIELVKTMSNE